MGLATIRRFEEYHVDNRTVRFDCELDREGTAEPSPHRTVPVTVEYLRPDSFRFCMDVNPEGTQGGNPLEADETEFSAPVDLTVSETDDHVRLETSDLEVVVGWDEWTFDVEDADGSSLLREDRSPIGPRDVGPLGFTDETCNKGSVAVMSAGTRFSFRHDEHLYGLGEKFTALDKRGQRVESWTVRAGGTESELAHKNVPFFLSTRGYGLLVETTNRVEFDFGTSSTSAMSIDVDGDSFQFVFFHGPSFRDVLDQFTSLTGRSRIPPKWSFGLWMSRAGYETRDEVEQVASRLRDERIPCDVLHIDPQWMGDDDAMELEWDRERFPDPESMIDGLHADDFRVSLWEHPYLPVDTAAFKEAADEGFLVEDGNGNPYVLDDLILGQYRGSIVDFTDRAAVTWWQDKHRPLLEMGVDAFKTDFGEDVPADGVFDDGRTGASVHNLYPNLYNRTVDEVLVEENGPDDAVTWGRSAWAGGQRYPLYWGGNPPATFDGMASALRGGLSLSLSGFPFWSHDIGGFWGDPSTELYVRWAQFGLLSSHARCHGVDPREPWAFGDEATRIFRKFAELRYRLLPYLYSAAATAARTGVPVVRPLVLEYQDDPQVLDVDDQYLLGPDLLVAPVLNADGVVGVYLPEGEWVDYWTGERVTGGRTLIRDVGLDSMPIFVRSESVIPKQEVTQTVPDTPSELTLDATLSTSGESTARATVYDEIDEELREVVVEASSDRTELDVRVPTSDWFAEASVVVDGFGSTPDRVTVNGERLPHTESVADEPGWTVEDGSRVVLARR